MGLVKCPDCQKHFSDRIESCPFCGCPKAEALVEIKTPIIQEEDVITNTKEDENLKYIDTINISTDEHNNIKCDLKKGSLAVVLICLFLAFVNLLHPYIENESTYDVGFFCGWFEIVFVSLLLMPVPVLVGVFKTNLTQKLLHRICLLNSIIVFVVALVSIPIVGQPVLGWITATLYYFINKNIVLLIRNGLEPIKTNRKKILLALGISFTILILSGAGCYVFTNNYFKDMYGTSGDNKASTQNGGDLKDEEVEIVHKSDVTPAEPIISYDVRNVIVEANSSGGVADIYSVMNTDPKYIIYDTSIGEDYEVNYKAIGGVAHVSSETFQISDGLYGISAYIYGQVQDCWYNVTLPDGTEGYIWGGTDAQYVTEIYN